MSPEDKGTGARWPDILSAANERRSSLPQEYLVDRFAYQRCLVQQTTELAIGFRGSAIDAKASKCTWFDVN